MTKKRRELPKQALNHRGDRPHPSRWRLSRLAALKNARSLAAELNGRLLLRQSEHFCGDLPLASVWRQTQPHARTAYMAAPVFNIVAEAFYRPLPIKPLTKAGAKGGFKQNLAVPGADRSDDAFPWALGERG
jgi:hypothetical protein